jgi:Fe-S cluster assembly protein SufD
MSMPAINHYLEKSRHLGRQLAGDGLESVRNTGVDRFQEQGFPGTRVENWKYTDVRPIAGGNFIVPHAIGDRISRDLVNSARLSGVDCHELVFINGHFAKEHSPSATLPEGVIVQDLAGATARHRELISTHIAHYADPAGNPFTALNTAFLQHGCLIFIPAETVLEKPVHLLYLSGMHEEPFAAHPRNLIILSANAKATVIESYIGLDDGSYFTNTVTEACLQGGSILHHYKVQQEGRGCYHVGNFDIQQGENSQAESHSIALGGALVRNDIRVRLAAEGAGITLNGLYLAGGHQHIDNHTRVDHLQPSTRSRENYRGVMNGNARGVFNGKVIVHKDAQKTDASQNNANLLLSDNAEVDTKPELEIYADDVKCAHGATVGQLDQDMLFYLRSRSIDETTAKSLLTYAFAEEIIREIGIAPLRQRLEQMVIGLLPDPELIREFAA